MRLRILFIVSFLLSFSAQAQQAVGHWSGKLSAPGAQFTIAFHITQESGQYQAGLDVVEQGAKDLKASSVAVEGKSVKISLDAIRVVYAGALTSDSTIAGEWQQSGLKLPLTLTKQKNGAPALSRPQAVKGPLPYESKDVYFENKTGLKLAGTLTLPKKDGSFPAVILVSGSGPQNRDSELFGHKSFEVLADYLTRNGIAVLRYDDRGTNKSEGNFSAATTFDFADDARAALQYLRKESGINNKKVGLVGHSEGGLIGEIIGSGEMRPDFLVLLAAPAADIDQLMLEQARLIGEVSGAPAERVKLQIETNARAFNLLKNGPITDSTRKKIEDIYFQQISTLAQGTMSEVAIRDQAAKIVQTFTPWFISFINLQPRQYLTKLAGPVLALYGAKDLQVPAGQNLTVMQDVLAANKKVSLTALELPDLNHLFQTAKTGNPSEYGQIAETFSPAALKVISD